MEKIELIKKEVENTKRSYRSIAEEYGTNHTQIRNLIKTYNWNVQHRLSKNISIPCEKVEISIIEPAVELTEYAKKLYDKLNADGKAVFNNLITELGVVYKPTFCFQIWLASKDFADFMEIAEKADKAEYTLFSSKTGSPYINPIHNLYKQKRDTLRNSLNDLGLLISAQKKLNIRFDVPEQHQLSIFEIFKDLDKDDDLNDI